MVSILIMLSTYNGTADLEQQLDSIRKQLAVDVTLLIRDDGSTDVTTRQIEDYKQQYPDFKIELIYGKNVGFARSFTALVNVATKKAEDGVLFDFYAFSDQDDVWLPEKLVAAVTKIKGLPQNMANVYCSNANLVDANLSFLRLMNPVGSVKLTKESFLLRNIAVGCTMLFNYRALWYYNTYTPRYIRVHDYVMFLIGVFLGNFVYDDTPYINYRQHTNNQIGIAMSMRERMQKRIKRIKKKEKQIQERSIGAFLDAYKHLLDSETEHLLSRVAYYKRSAWNRLSLLFSRKFTLGTWEKSFFVKLKIVLGTL